MPNNTWNKKRERQYQHIKQSKIQSGSSEALAKEVAARTVNKERARHGETTTASRTSINDISSSRRGGLRSHSGAGGRTFAQLYNEAKSKGIKGRSHMSKQQLENAVNEIDRQNGL